MKLVVIGGGEHARVVIEAARSRPDLWDVVGVVDASHVPETEARLGVRRLGTDVEGTALAREGDVGFILGLAAIGSNRTREKLVRVYDDASVCWATVVHSSAWVSPSARLDAGVFVSAGACINTGAQVERHAIVNTGAIVEHDVRVGAFTHLAPSAAIGGGARLGEHVYVGLGARVRDHLEVGAGATIGMGAAVVRAVDEGSTVVGNPARPQGSSIR